MNEAPSDTPIGHSLKDPGAEIDLLIHIHAVQDSQAASK